MICDQTNLLMESGKEEQIQTAGNRRIEIININVEISKT